MKTKRFVASPKMLIIFTILVCLALCGLAGYLAGTFSRAVDDVVMTVFLTGLLACMAIALFIVGFTMGAFDLVCMQEDTVLVSRFGKKLRVYRLSQNTQIYVQKNHKGSQYIEVQFPEYFDSAAQNFKGVLLRDGYVRLSYSDSRLQYVRDIVQNYKRNIAPIEQPTQTW